MEERKKDREKRERVVQPSILLLHIVLRRYSTGALVL